MAYNADMLKKQYQKKCEKHRKSFKITYRNSRAISNRILQTNWTTEAKFIIHRKRR